jgi:hypothetical protein
MKESVAPQNPFQLRIQLPRLVFQDNQQWEAHSVFNSNEYPPELEHKISDCLIRYQAVVTYAENTLAEMKRYRESGFVDDLSFVNGELPLERECFGELSCPNVLANFEALLLATKGLLDVLCHHLLSYKTGKPFQGFNKDHNSAGGKVIKTLTGSVSVADFPERQLLIDFIEHYKSLWIDELVRMRDTVTHYGSLRCFMGFWIIFEAGRRQPYTVMDVHDPVLETGETVADYCQRIGQGIKEFTEGFRDLLFPADQRESYITRQE